MGEEKKFSRELTGPMKGILIEPWSIGYRHIPKVACTSIKEALYEAGTGSKFSKKTADGAQHVHDYFNRRLMDISEAKFRFIVVRDPVKRFLSGFGNRVGHYKELSEEYVRNLEVASQINFDKFVFDPTIDQFIDRFEMYKKVPTIKHHFRPVSKTIPPLSRFDKVYRIEELKTLESDLAEIMQRPFTIPHTQIRGLKLTIKDVDPALRQRLVQLCASDYDLLKSYYSPDQLQ